MPYAASEQAAELLGNTGFLSALPKEELDELVSHLRRVEFEAGQTVFAKGARASNAYWVAEGRFKVTATTRLGTELLLTMVEVGEVCGEISAIEGGLRSSTAVAEGPSAALSLDRRYLLGALERHPETMLALVRVLCGHIRNAVTNLETLGLHSAETRIWSRLLDLSHRYPGTDSGDGSVRIEHGLSQQGLADSVGLTRVMVNRQLRFWRERGLVEYARGVTTILDPEAFEAYVWRGLGSR